MHKGLVGFAKYSILVFVLAAFVVGLVLNMGVVSATHDAIVTISPNIANCEELGNTFTVNIENDNSVQDADDIFEVRIYSGTYGIVDFACGLAPCGWTLHDFTSEYGYCEYKTAWDGAYVIEPGEDLDFTFDATMEYTEQCYSEFLVSTLDNKRPVGEHEYNWPQVDIDCTPPEIEKEIISGTYTGVCPPETQDQGEFCWMTHGTIHVNADDDNDDCDLGIDYCEWEYTIDGVYEDGDTEYDDGYIEFDIDFDKDSVHVLTITCVDVAGNEVTDVETFKVDDTPPTTEKDFIGPKKIVDGIEWIDGVTEVELTAEDGGDICHIDGVETYYVNVWAEWFVDEFGLKCDPEFPCWDPAYCQSLVQYGYMIPEFYWSLYEGQFPKEEESCHVLFYYSVDELGNTEDMQVNCFFVDKTPPEMIKTVGDPKVAEGGIEELVMDDNEESPTVDVTKTWDCAKVIWDFELEDQGDPYCDYGHTEFGLVIGFSDDQAEFQVGTGQMFGAGSPPIYQECDGPSMDPPYGCWAGGSGPTHDLLPGIVVDNPGGSGEPGYGDRVFHVEIPMQYLNSGDFYWALSTYGGQNYGYCKSGYQDYPDTWNKWSGAGIYADAGLGECWVRDDTYMEGTPITLTCTDPEPHPAGDEEVCYKVSLDSSDVTYPDYCPEELTLIEQEGHAGEWCCLDQEAVIVFHEDTLHDLEWFCKDAVDKKTPIDIEWFRVDSQPPIIEKDMFGFYLGDCPSGTDIEHGDCYVADDGSSGVDITVYDDDTYPDCVVDDLYCYYDLTWILPTGERIPIEENYEFSTQAKITFTEDSTHELYIYCEDALGNYVEHTEYFLVDSTPPETLKEYGEPQKVDPDCVEWCGFESQDPEWMEWCTHMYCTWWINSSTSITLTAEDEKVGVDTIYWRNLWFPENDEICNLEPPMPNDGPIPTVTNGDGLNGDGVYCHPEYYLDEYYETTGWNEYIEPFYKPEESCHVIEYYAVDALGNEEELHWQCVFVDNTPPESIKEVGDPKIETWTHGMLEPDNGDGNSDNWELRTTAYGTDNHDFGSTVYGTTNHGEHAGYEHSYLMSPLISLPAGDITLSFDSYTANEGGCPEEYDVEWIEISDDGSTWTTLNTCEDDGGADYLHNDSNNEQWRTFSYDISAFAGEDVRIRFRYNTGDDCCGDEDQEGWYLDNVQVTEDDNIVFYEDFERVVTYVTWDTPITLECEDPEPHPVDQETLCFKVSLDDEGMEYLTEDYCEEFEGEMNDEDYCCVYAEEEEFEFYFLEDSNHNLEYYCVDHLGNDERTLMGGEPHIQWYKVDDTPPTTTKEFHGEFYEVDGVEWIDTASWITLEAEDGGEICAVGVDKIWYMNIIDLTEQSCWIEEACQPVTHLVPFEGEWSAPYEEIECIDFMQEWCASDCEGEPCWDDEGFDSWHDCVEYYAHDECGVDPIWQLYDGTPIQKEEESCHILTYFAIDHLGNVEEPQANCFFVDKRPPEIDKWYGDPYFDNEAEWITSDTPVYVEVEDSEPHPSGVREVSYRVTMVNDENCWDWETCQEAEGSGEWTEGSEEFEFTIDEESCHLIEIYAEDNVGKNDTHKQCVFVDNSSPEPDKKVGDPKWMWDGEDAYYYDIADRCWKNEIGETLSEEECKADPFCYECWRTTLLTPVFLDCIDPEPHPVDHETVCFHVSWDGDDVTGEYCDTELTDGFCCVDHEMEFYFDRTSEHELEYYCIDALGNEGETLDIEKFKVEDTAFDITLNKKWNLISTPVFLLEDHPEAVFSDIEEKVKGVWAYDSVNDKWYSWTPHDPAFDDLHELGIIPGWGYWVLMDDDAILTIGGSLMRPGPTGMASKEIIPGWNLIGYYGADGYTEYEGPYGNGGEAYCELYSLGEDIWDKEFTGLFGYWEPDNPEQWEEYSRYDNLDPGAGYWLATPHEGLYTPSTECWWD